MTHLTIKIGTSDFRHLRERGGYYVDKSLFIAAVIESSDIIVLPRPRRFGKTLNMSTLKIFIDRKEKDQDKLFAGLKILDQPQAILRHKARHPVIALTLKDWKFARFEDLEICLREHMAELFRDNDDILPSLSDFDRVKFEEILSMNSSSMLLTQSLLLLSGWMKRIHGEEVAILIDDYDSPLIEAWKNGFLPAAEKLLHMWFLSGIKDNPALFKGILSGQLSLEIGTPFSTLNAQAATITHAGVFEDKFGFTEDEVATMLADFGKSDKMEEARQWYNGYRFGASTIYNPWSITHYAKSHDKFPRPYWVNTSDNALVYQSLAEREDDIRDDLQAILEG
ncbi:MAG: hypothetical protein RL095_2868 [Verrucomicrobiota bacterium]|jgi:hypothetical protein